MVRPLPLTQAEAHQFDADIIYDLSAVKGDDKVKKVALNAAKRLEQLSFDSPEYVTYIITLFHALNAIILDDPWLKEEIKKEISDLTSVN